MASASTAGGDPLLDWINTICNPPIPTIDSLRDCIFLKDIFMSFVPNTLTSEVEDMVRAISPKQGPELNAPVLAGAIGAFAENANLLVVPPITKNISFDADDVIRDLVFNILVCGLQSKKRKSLLTKIQTDMSGPAQEKLRKVLAPYQGDKLLDPAIDLRGIIVLAQKNQPESPQATPASKPARGFISLDQFQQMNQGGSGKFNSWSATDSQKADPAAYNNTYTGGENLPIGRKSRDRKSIKNVTWGKLPPPSNPDPLNPFGLDNDDNPPSSIGSAENGAITNDLVLDTGSNSLQTVNAPASKNITFVDTQHAIDQVKVVASNMNQGAVNPQTNELLAAVSKELTNKISELSSSIQPQNQAPDKQAIASQLAQLEQNLKETQNKQIPLRTNLQSQDISVPSYSSTQSAAAPLVGVQDELIQEMYKLVRNSSTSSGTSTDANQTELGKQVMSLVFELLRAANTGTGSMGVRAGDALSRATSFGLGIMVTLMMFVMVISLLSDIDLHDHTMLRPT